MRPMILDLWQTRDISSTILLLVSWQQYLLHHVSWFMKNQGNKKEIPFFWSQSLLRFSDPLPQQRYTMSKSLHFCSTSIQVLIRGSISIVILVVEILNDTKTTLVFTLLLGSTIGSGEFIRVYCKACILLLSSICIFQTDRVYHP